MSLLPSTPGGRHRLVSTLFWLYLLLILLLTLSPAPYLKSLSAFTFWDKAEHCLAFLLLAWLALLAWPVRPLQRLLVLLGFGGAIELLQAATGWRSGEWADWLADGIGLDLGGLVWLSMHRFLPAGLR